MDAEAVWEEAAKLYEVARTGGRPGFIIANAYRFYGHGRKDPSPYRAKEEEEQWKRRDPNESYRKRLVEEKVITEEPFAELETHVKQEVDRAVEYASGCTSPSDEERYADVYANEG